MKNLNESFLEVLAEMFDAEKQQLKALSDAAMLAKTEELRLFFEGHLMETRGHIEQVRKVFRALDKTVGGRKCEAMQELVLELIQAGEGEPSAVDEGLIWGAQRIEHYEMASYGCLVPWAELLGDRGVFEMLSEIQDQEEDSNQRLAELGDRTRRGHAIFASHSEPGQLLGLPF